MLAPFAMVDVLLQMRSPYEAEQASQDARECRGGQI
jgi:hypothetical protein